MLRANFDNTIVFYFNIANKTVSRIIFLNVYSLVIILNVTWISGSFKSIKYVIRMIFLGFSLCWTAALLDFPMKEANNFKNNPKPKHNPNIYKKEVLHEMLGLPGQKYLMDCTPSLTRFPILGVYICIAHCDSNSRPLPWRWQR